MKKILIVFCLISIFCFSSCVKYFKFVDLYNYVNSLEDSCIVNENDNNEYCINKKIFLKNENDYIVAIMKTKIDLLDGDFLSYQTKISFQENSSIAYFSFAYTAYISQYDNTIIKNCDGYILLKNYYGYSTDIYFIEEENDMAKNAVIKIMNELKTYLNSKGYAMTTLNIQKF